MSDTKIVLMALAGDGFVRIQTFVNGFERQAIRLDIKDKFQCHRIGTTYAALKRVGYVGDQHGDVLAEACIAWSKR
jgi:hypothetical protein